MPLLFLRQSLMRSFDLGRKPDAEYLPVTFDLHSDLGKPLLDILQQLPQLSLVGTEDREVVHLPQIETLDECSELLHIFIHIIFDLNDLFVQAVIAVSPMAGVHFLNCQTKVFVRYDLFVNSNSFHQGCFSSL